MYDKVVCERECVMSAEAAGPGGGAGYRIKNKNPHKDVGNYDTPKTRKTRRPGDQKARKPGDHERIKPGNNLRKKYGMKQKEDQENRGKETRKTGREPGKQKTLEKPCQIRVQNELVFRVL